MFPRPNIYAMDYVNWDSITSLDSHCLTDPNIIDAGAYDSPAIIPQPIFPTEWYTGTCEQDLQVSISSTFHPSAILDTFAPDLSIVSSDATFFFVHTHRLLAYSSNGFGFLLPITSPGAESQPCLQVPMEENVLNVLLHTIYGISVASFRPPLATVFAAMDAMETYGYSVKMFLAPSMPLHSLLVTYAPTSPFECYARAASLDAEDLAVAASAYLPPLPLWKVTDEDAKRMGPIYLKRLVFLHLGRVEALKRLLRVPPDAHTPTKACDLFAQNRLQHSWMLAVSYLTWEHKPGLTGSAIEFALRHLADETTCEECRTLLWARIKKIQVEWSFVKHTI